jgi:hypothetical protein
MAVVGHQPNGSASPHQAKGGIDVHGLGCRDLCWRGPSLRQVFWQRVEVGSMHDLGDGGAEDHLEHLDIFVLSVEGMTSVRGRVHTRNILHASCPLRYVWWSNESLCVVVIDGWPAASSSTPGTATRPYRRSPRLPLSRRRPLSPGAGGGGCWRTA